MPQDQLLEKLEPLFPLDFFALTFNLAHAKNFRQLTTLPSTSAFLGEEEFAKVSMGWNQDALLVQVDLNKPFEECFFPRFNEGDAIELFFDTRDLKTAGFLTRFCHHFVVLPQKVGEIQAAELTRFRTEDSHPLCDAQEIGILAKFGKRDYFLQITIPSNCLHGYDPNSFDRLGVAYRIHRFKGKPQNFSVSSTFPAVEQEAAYWGRAKLVR